MIEKLIKEQVSVAVINTALNNSVKESFREGLQRFSGLIPNDLPQLAVIKPNLCDNAAWETGVTTDPGWVPILAEELRRIRPDINIQIVESDAISAYKAFRSCDETFERLGFREAAQSAGVELVNLSRQDSWEVEIPTFPDPIRIPALFFEEFYFISLANVKLHPYERFTGTMKNNYGLVPQANRTALHKWLPEILFTLYQLCRTDLAILDGRIGLEGRGPILGRPKRLNRLIIGNDALSVDEVACRLIGLDPKSVPHLRYAARQTQRTRQSVQISGDVTPVPFVTDDPDTSSLIIRKFAVRRFHYRLEQLSLRATQSLHNARNNPIAFCKRAMRRLLPI